MQSSNSPRTRRGYASKPRIDRASPPLKVPDAVKETIRVLVVDDEHTLRKSCESLLTSDGFTVVACGEPEEAAELIRRGTFHIVLADVFMEPLGGMELVQIAVESPSRPIVILMTGKPSVESSIEGLRAGAWDYLSKPFSASQLHIVVGRAAHAVMVARESEAKESGDRIHACGSGTEMIGRSNEFLEAVELARKVASTDASVFLTGETGTGKELLAHLIHQNSRRRARPLIPVNAAAIPETLLESEMFGHVKGAFTGAGTEKEGLLETADGGTLFLDEIMDMPLSVQAKLLRVIQDGVVRRVGSTRTDAVVNVRFIAASNVDPMKGVHDGRLRKDLYYRLRVVPIHIPPLRERVEDIPVLARFYLEDSWKKHRGAGPCPALSAGAIERLMEWPWRGNIRELKNVMEHLAVLATGKEVDGEEIPFIHDELDGETSTFGFQHQLSGLDYHDAREKVLMDFERRYLELLIRRAGGNIAEAARKANVDRTTLYRLMEKHETCKQDLLERTSRQSHT